MGNIKRKQCNACLTESLKVLILSTKMTFRLTENNINFT